MWQHHVRNDSVFIFPAQRLWISPGPTHMLQDLARCALQALQTPQIHCPGLAAALHRGETRILARLQRRGELLQIFFAAIRERSCLDT